MKFNSKRVILKRIMKKTKYKVIGEPKNTVQSYFWKGRTAVVTISAWESDKPLGPGVENAMDESFVPK